MSKKFANLYTEPSNIRDVMAGPWRDVRVDRVVAGDALELASETVEHSCFVISGEAVLRNGDGKEFPLEPRTAFSLPRGGAARITASSDLSLLHVEMDLPA